MARLPHALPPPTSIKYIAKPFVDVTMDRFAKAMGVPLEELVTEMVDADLERLTRHEHL
jgi:hypothetical protein